MESFKTTSPIPVAEVNPISQACLMDLLDIVGGIRKNTGGRILQTRRSLDEASSEGRVLAARLGIDDIPFRPHTYRIETEVNPNTRLWHVDGGLGFFDSPNVAMFANTNPPEIIEGELPIYTEGDWNNLVEDNDTVEDALASGTARVRRLETNIYYLLPSPTIHRSPELIDVGLVRLFGRWMD